LSTRILVIDGHPDPAGDRFGNALAEAYASAAAERGHEVRRLRVARMDVAFIRTRAEWEEGEPSEAIRAAQADAAWANHIVIFYPLWLGTLPALLKTFLEQLFRPSFAFHRTGDRWQPALTGRSARLVVTMGMPSFVYRWYFRAHSVKSLERNVLGFCGIRPVRESLIGLVEGSPERRRRWLGRMRELGRDAM